MLRHAVISCLVLWAACVPAQGIPVSPGLWDRPRSATAVLGETGVKQAVSAYLAQPGSRLVIRHGTAQDAALQAEELRSWLVALAVESGHITLERDLKPGEALRVEVRR